VSRKIAALVRYLDLGVDEAQWAALGVFIGIGIIVGALVLGIAVRVFTCAGGWSC